MPSKHAKIFNIIAPIYAKFFDYQLKYYQETIIKAKAQLDIRDYKTVLDIGCGTGALCYVLHKNGLSVTGVDVAKNMVEKSKEKLKGTGIGIKHVSEDQDLPFPDKSFDLVIASYVAHGLQADQRVSLYKEAARLAKEKVIFHDFNKTRSLPITIVEWLEGGDYFNYIKLAESEMKEHFNHVNIIDVHKRAAWYVGVPRGT